MPSVIVSLLTVGVTIYALVDCLRSPRDEVRVLPRTVWALLTLLVPLVGGVAYLVVGRPRVPVAAGRVVPPDDDVDFLRSIDVRDDRKRPGLRARWDAARDRDQGPGRDTGVPRREPDPSPTSSGTPADDGADDSGPPEGSDDSGSSGQTPA